MARKTEKSDSPNESRRDFGRGVAAALASATLAPAGLMLPRSVRAGDLTALQEDQAADLSAAARAEIDAKVQHIIARWGDRLSEDQRTRLRATVTRHVRMLESVRSFPLENGDPPAPVLRILEEKPGADPHSKSSAPKRAQSANPASHEEE